MDRLNTERGEIIRRRKFADRITRRNSAEKNSAPGKIADTLFSFIAFNIPYPMLV